MESLAPHDRLSASQILGQIPAFVQRLLAAIASRGLDVSALTLDHVCLRVATQDEYLQLKVELHGLGELLSEAIIHGRPIATFKLHEAVRAGERAILVVELPSPGKKPYRTGLEHAEFVLNESLEDFAAARPDLDWDLSGLSKEINAELALTVAPGLAVKFHRQSLEEVIELEQNLF